MPRAQAFASRRSRSSSRIARPGGHGAASCIADASSSISSPSRRAADRSRTPMESAESIAELYGEHTQLNEPSGELVAQLLALLDPDEAVLFTCGWADMSEKWGPLAQLRSEEHTSELQ